LAHFRFSEVNPVVHSANFSALASVDGNLRTSLVGSSGDNRAVIVHSECVGNDITRRHRFIARHANLPARGPLLWIALQTNRTTA
jgi:hypothetical protein